MNTFEKTIEELKTRYNDEKTTYLERKDFYENEVQRILVGHFPFVVNIRIDFNSIIIYTRNNNSEFPDEITINNKASLDFNYGEDNDEKYSPEISLSSMRADINNEDKLNQMILIGYLAQEMKNSNSLLFEKFKEVTLMVEKLSKICNKTNFEINNIESKKRKFDEKKKREDFEKNFKKGNYYIQKRNSRVKTYYHIIKIIKVSSKTVTIMRTENIGINTVDNFEKEIMYYTKRVKLDNIYNTLMMFELSTIDDVKECVDNHLKEEKKLLES